MLEHVRGEAEEHALHPSAGGLNVLLGASLPALVGPLEIGVVDVGLPRGRDRVERRVDLLLHELHAVGREPVRAADQVVDEEGRGAEGLLADVVDLGRGEAEVGVNPHGLEHHPAEETIGREARDVADRDEGHAERAEELADRLRLRLAGERPLGRHLPELVGQVGEEGVENAAALATRQAVEELLGGQAAGRREDVGLGIPGPEGAVEGALEVKALGDRLEDEADLEALREVIDAALNDRDPVIDRRDLIGEEAGLEGFVQAGLDLLHCRGEIEGDHRNAVTAEETAELAELAESDVSAAAGDDQRSRRAVGIRLEDRSHRGVADLLLLHEREDRGAAWALAMAHRLSFPTARSVIYGSFCCANSHF